MSPEDWAFAPPAFDPDNALVQLKRALRDLKLTERGNGYELRGKRVLELSREEGGIHARMARRAVLTPEWDRISVKSAAEQRKLVDELKRRLERWQRED